MSCSKCGRAFTRYMGWNECKKCGYIQTPEDAPSIQVEWRCESCKKAIPSTLFGSDCICPHCGGYVSLEDEHNDELDERLW